MTSQEKIDLINTLHSKVVDWDADGECCYYVYVPLDDETRDVLKRLGYDDNYINLNSVEGLGQLLFDLTQVGFDFADWWHSESGFSLTKPIEC